MSVSRVTCQSCWLPVAGGSEVLVVGPSGYAPGRLGSPTLLRTPRSVGRRYSPPWFGRCSRPSGPSWSLGNFATPACSASSGGWHPASSVPPGAAARTAAAGRRRAGAQRMPEPQHVAPGQRIGDRGPVIEPGGRVGRVDPADQRLQLVEQPLGLGGVSPSWYRADPMIRARSWLTPADRLGAFGQGLGKLHGTSSAAGVPVCSRACSRRASTRHQATDTDWRGAGW